MEVSMLWVQLLIYKGNINPFPSGVSRLGERRCVHVTVNPSHAYVPPRTPHYQALSVSWEQAHLISLRSGNTSSNQLLILSYIPTWFCCHSDIEIKSKALIHMAIYSRETTQTPPPQIIYIEMCAERGGGTCVCSGLVISTGGEIQTSTMIGGHRGLLSGLTSIVTT